MDTTIERVLPANIKAEQMLLGAVLINPILIEQVSEFLRAEHFFEPLHQKIYNSIEVVSDKGLTPSVIALKSMLDKEPLSDPNWRKYCKYSLRLHFRKYRC
jgi:replicative DNA helicase